MTVIIDRDGSVRDVIEGIMYADEFEQKVKPLLFGKVALHGCCFDKLSETGSNQPGEDSILHHANTNTLMLKLN